jgi:hypothetical protein
VESAPAGKYATSRQIKTEATGRTAFVGRLLLLVEFYLMVRSQNMKPHSLIALTALLSVLAPGGVGAQHSGEVKFLKISVP